MEIIRGHGTGDQTMAAATALDKNMGKITVEVKKESPGFIPPIVAEQTRRQSEPPRTAFFI
ncbi:MAG: hypothetical protein ACM34H_01355 [Deltaproteobacteria bacterium]